MAIGRKVNALSANPQDHQDLSELLSLLSIYRQNHPAKTVKAIKHLLTGKLFCEKNSPMSVGSGRKRYSCSCCKTAVHKSDIETAALTYLTWLDMPITIKLLADEPKKTADEKSIEIYSLDTTQQRQIIDIALHSITFVGEPRTLRVSSFFSLKRAQEPNIDDKPTEIE